METYNVRHREFSKEDHREAYIPTAAAKPSSESIVVGIRLDKRIVDFLKQKAATEVLSSRSSSSYNELIREAIVDKYSSELVNYLLVGEFKDYYRGFSQSFVLEDYTDSEGDLWEKMFSTDEGKVALSIAIAKSVGKFVSINSVTRLALQVDELPIGAAPRYGVQTGMTISQGFGLKSLLKYGIAERVDPTMGDEVLLPFFELAQLPAIKLSEIKARRFAALINLFKTSSVNMVISEELNLFACLASATEESRIHVANIDDLISVIKTNLTEFGSGWTILMNGEVYEKLKTTNPDIGIEFRLHKANQDSRCFEAAYRKPEIGKKDAGWVRVVNTCPKNRIFVLPPQEKSGVFAIRQDITCLPADDPRRLELGWVCFEEIAMGIFTKEVFCVEFVDECQET